MATEYFTKREVDDLIASEVREKDELIQRLADRLAAEVREAFYFTNDSRELEETDKRSSAAVVKVMESFGLRKVGGTWEKVNG